MIDRLTLDEGGDAVEEVDAPVEYPEEERLRLEDGTLLPPELTELRALLELTAASSASSAVPAPEADADPEHAAQLAAIATAKADMLRDCLLEFDEGMLLLHDKLLDHEQLVKRLDALRRSKAAVPAGKLAFDEAVDFEDDEEDQDELVGLSDLLAADAPGGAGAASSVEDRGCRGGGTSQVSAAEAESSEQEDEETLDQRVSTSRQQIKAWLRALEQGKQEQNKQLQPGGKLKAPKGALPPVRPPPKARENTTYSMRLRQRTATWSARELQ